MKKVIRVQTIVEYVVDMENSIKILENERKTLFDTTAKLKEVNSTPSINRIANQIMERIYDLDGMIETFKYYCEYINNTMEFYDKNFKEYKRLLVNNISDQKVNL